MYDKLFPQKGPFAICKYPSNLATAASHGFGRRRRLVGTESWFYSVLRTTVGTLSSKRSKINGEAQDMLSKRLGEYKGTTFTKILTTDGADVKYLVGIRDAKADQLL